VGWRSIEVERMREHFLIPARTADLLGTMRRRSVARLRGRSNELVGDSQLEDG